MPQPDTLNQLFKLADSAGKKTIMGIVSDLITEDYLENIDLNIIPKLAPVCLKVIDDPRLSDIWPDALNIISFAILEQDVKPDYIPMQRLIDLIWDRADRIPSTLDAAIICASIACLGDIAYIENDAALANDDLIVTLADVAQLPHRWLAGFDARAKAEDLLYDLIVEHGYVARSPRAKSIVDAQLAMYPPEP